MPPPTPHLSVVLLIAGDAARTAAFYRDVVGLPLVGEEHDGRSLHFACPLGGAYFTIQPSADLAAPPAGGYDFLQLCFAVDDLEGFIARARERGVEPLHPPQAFEHTTFTTYRDPDGRHVRVMTPWAKG